MLHFPATQHSFRTSIIAAIEFYQGAPVDGSKVDGAIAAALNAVPEVLEQEETNPYPISFDNEGNQSLVINGVRIDRALADDGVISLSVYDRIDTIRNIRIYMGEAVRAGRHSDIELMQSDLDILLASEEEFVLGYVDTNGFLAADLDPDLFNTACDELLKVAADFYSDKVGQPTKMGRCFKHCISYYSAEEMAPIYEGELVLIQATFLNDSRLPLGMAVEKFEGEVPEGYVAACIGNDGEYVPIELNDDE